jgi:hypothetical protein
MSCITEILKFKSTQDVLVPEGNWVAVEGGGTYRDYEYLIILNTLGHRCGYVALPPEHKYSKTPSEERKSRVSDKIYKHWDYDSLDIECHGGLTFMSPKNALKNLLDIPCDDIWIGFDCGHFNDKCDTEAFRKYFGEEEFNKKESFFKCMNHADIDIGRTVKKYEYVEMECQSIIDQLIQVAA